MSLGCLSGRVRFIFSSVKVPESEVVHTVIQLHDVIKTYQSAQSEELVLDTVSLTITSGQCVGLVGQSGQGKSTLLRLINGLVLPTSGDVIVHGRHIPLLDDEAMRRHRYQTAMIFQNYTLVSNLNIRKNIGLPLKFMGSGVPQSIEAVAELVGVQDKLDVFPAQLSGGEKQRVAIARALITNPEILLCDEITASLDDSTSLGILEVLHRINQEFGTTIVFASHKLSDVQYIADRVLVLHQHRLVDDFSNPHKGRIGTASLNYPDYIREVLQ